MNMARQFDLRMDLFLKVLEEVNNKTLIRMITQEYDIEYLENTLDQSRPTTQTQDNNKNKLINNLLNNNYRWTLKLENKKLVSGKLVNAELGYDIH